MAMESNFSSEEALESHELMQVNPPPQMIAKSITISLEGLLWVILAVLTVFLRLWMLGARVMSHDESLHVYYSWLLANGNGYAHNPMMHGPSLFEATALVNAIFGANDFTSRLVPAILGMLVAILIPLLLRPWLGRNGALAAGLLLSVSPYLLYYSRYIRHDMQVIAWTLLAFVAILSYQRTRSERYLFLLAISLALMFATMEITFIYLAIFAAFLVLAILFRFRLNWMDIRKSAEFDLFLIIALLGAFFSSPIALLALNPLWNKITGQPFVDLSVLSSFGLEWSSNSAGIRLWGLLGAFSLAAFAIGWWWGKFLWLKLVGLFLGISLILFTTLFTNLEGFGTGFIGSLGYWLSQHSVQRGSQPWFYYLLVFPLYEYVPLLFGMLSGVFFIVRRKRFAEPVRFFGFMTLFWAVTLWIGMSIAGEKMPWLSTHLVVPWILLAAWGIGHMLQEYRREPRRQYMLILRPLLTSAAVFLVLVSIRTSFMVNFINYDYTTEPIGYAHGAPGVKWALEDISTIAERTGKGKQLVVAYDDHVAWPMTWYLRDYPGFFGANLSPGAVANADVVVVSTQNWQKADLILGSDYKRYEVIRMWWPIEDYKNLTFNKIMNDFTDPSMRSAVWQILWNRDYSSYAALTGQPGIDPPRDWPLQDRMRVYIRAELAGLVSPGKLAAFQLDDLPAIADAYDDLRASDQPVSVLAGMELDAPRNLVFAGNDILYVLDTGRSKILKVNTAGEVLAEIGSRSPEDQAVAPPGTFKEPWGIALDDAGNLYVADTWNHRIQKFDPDGNYLLSFGSGGLSENDPYYMWGPRAIAVRSDGSIYVTDTGNRRVAVFSSTGQFLFNFEQAGDASLDEPVGMAVHEDHVYIADTWNRRIVTFTPKGKYQTSWPVYAWSGASLDNKPYLAVDDSGSIYISDPEGFRVIQFSPAGDALTVLGLSPYSLDQFMLPNGLAFDSQGQLWIADAANNQVLAYSFSSNRH
jgi:uncharacterized protein (TIGR03663 family)